MTAAMAESDVSRAVRLSSTRSNMSMSSISSDIMATMTTANCEMAVLPLRLLLDLQPNFLNLESGVFTSHNQRGGFNVISDGSALIDGQQCRVINYIQRKVTLKSHIDYKDYRDAIFAKPMLFLTNVRKASSDSVKTFAFIVNTRHPQMKARIESGMNDAISSVMGENYFLQFNLNKSLKDYLERQNFQLTEDNLNFSFTFKLDVFLDVFYLLGRSKKSCDVTGKILSLYCTNNDKKERVKAFLSKMTCPLIKLGNSFDHDRRPSVYSLDVIAEDPFPPEMVVVSDTEPVLPLSPGM
ncbi:mesenteric estrogen-dependent adipogenesis protein [Rana temporaria]|uniref:mesenteric estrogen-dependent adipogenesis protein n=1 Tax=Rana temporaria TaxID=8407 RepID=UPI001AAE0A0F|nr:mesenteric estrogen-dependent adipogenesis protein [Rana temporaria]